MSAYTILRLMISVLVMNQSVSTQSTLSITSDQPEVTLLAMMNRSSENVNANATRTHFALNGTGDFSYVESNFMNGLPRSNNPLQQLLTQVQNSMHKYVIFTVNIFSFFSCIITIVVLQKGALRSSSTVYIRGIAMSSILTTLLYFMYAANAYESVFQSRTFQNFNSYIFAYFDVSFFISMTANVWIVLAFAMERVFAIWLPIKAKIFNNECRARKIVAIIFLAAILVKIPRFLRITVITRIDPLTNDTLHVLTLTPLGMDPYFQKAFYISYAVIVVIILTPILAILNGLIIIRLRSLSRKQLQLRESDMKMMAGIGDQKEAQIERVLMASLVAFLFCYIPVASSSLVSAFDGPGNMLRFHFGFRILFIVGSIKPDLTRMSRQTVHLRRKRDPLVK